MAFYNARSEVSMSVTIQELAGRTCKENPSALGSAHVAMYVSALPEWGQVGDAIEKTFKFKDFHETMKFVNAVADIANQQNHHPDLAVSYNQCGVKFSTHSAGGLTESDFICAAKVEQVRT
jgi:4a-hydroxytetrahydrobiopterin dehydratase